MAPVIRFWIAGAIALSGKRCVSLHIYAAYSSHNLLFNLVPYYHKSFLISQLK
ncbi:hypothetical protein FC72_GL001707 [Companilactobacillus tucceti DSM 20183]|uniref:Uncharacterized protein n=1 Tax=Companilactobacillus tucceti DSM 20183 TaxID=1423811 RepID=A0A0R1J1F7_9LACO|nr:hypothetical protein FC72_GL001707 [Companilactobacillus tucceti DSM 20183]